VPSRRFESVRIYCVLGCAGDGDALLFIQPPMGTCDEDLLSEPVMPSRLEQEGTPR
jgi:hypothetical protein